MVTAAIGTIGLTLLSVIVYLAARSISTQRANMPPDEKGDRV